MRIMVMTDMEGVAGILDHDDWVMKDSRYYEKGKRLLTEEVNAAVAGLFEGGATEVVVADGHGAGGIDPELLDERAQLLHLKGENGIFPFGLTSEFAGIGWVGQHAKAGTDYSHITHTQWFNLIDISVNGLSIGEYGQMALCARELGVPCILACGEEAFRQEAEALTPGVVTVAVKKGLKKDGLDALDTDQYRAAKLSALHLSPAEARRRIRAGALTAIMKLWDQPDGFRFPELNPPYVCITRYRKFGDRPAWTGRKAHPTSFIALMNQRDEPINGA